MPAQAIKDPPADHGPEGNADRTCQEKQAHLLRIVLDARRLEQLIARTPERADAALDAAAEAGVEIARASFDELFGHPLIVFRSTPETSWQMLAKQTLDHGWNRKQIKERIKDWRGDFWRV